MLPYLCKTVFLIRGLNTCKISVNYDYWYMYNVQTMVLVYRVLIGGGAMEAGGHLDWQVLRAPQYVNPALRTTFGLLRHTHTNTHTQRETDRRIENDTSFSLSRLVKVYKTA